MGRVSMDRRAGIGSLALMAAGQLFFLPAPTLVKLAMAATILFNAYLLLRDAHQAA